jgi:aspartate kinase
VSKSRSSSASGTATPNGIFSPNPAHSRDNSQTPPMTPSVRDKSGIFNLPSDLQPLSTLTGNSQRVVPVDPSPAFNKTVDLIREEHVKHAKECIRDEGILGELVEEIERECEWLRSFLFASQVRCFLSFFLKPLSQPVSRFRFAFTRSSTRFLHDRKIRSLVLERGYRVNL